MYGDVAALDHIDLTIEQGDDVTLLGPSGSGKTTTLNLIAGFTEVTEGEILVAGQPMMSTPAHNQALAWCSSITPCSAHDCQAEH